MAGIAIIVELEDFEPEDIHHHKPIDFYVQIIGMIKGVKDVGYTENLSANDIYQLDELQNHTS